MDEERAAVSLWFGAFVVSGSSVQERYLVPFTTEGLSERMALRHGGHLTPEELALIAAHAPERLRTADRRLASAGLRWDPRAPLTVDPREFPLEKSVLREALLAEADRALRASWDPSIHVTEAVRALADLERAQNLIGERLGSWAARDSPELDPGDARRAAAAVLEPPSGTPRPEGPAPALEDARRSLAKTYRSLGETRDEVERAIQGSGPERTPNLVSLLGADLAARLVAQAGSLERLSRLPASTIQVLGAERAFFEHLRGRAPPPRHGLLFLHPKIQTAPRALRGRLARALAGKAAIAARLDRARGAIDPRLVAQFEARALAIGKSPIDRTGRKRSRPPLHRATPDR